MIPTTTHHRIYAPGGLWTPKLVGILQEGDPSITNFFYEGSVAIRELGGHLRIFFDGIKIIRRDKIPTRAEKLRLMEKLKKDKEDSLTAETDSVEHNDLIDESSLSEIADRILEEGRKIPISVPKVSLYLTTKKPKTRMVDAHKSGTRIRLRNTNDGMFGNEFETRNYDGSLRDIPDALNYQGVVALKLPEDEPKTEEPVIFGIVKLKSAKSSKVKNADAIHLTQILENLPKDSSAITTPAERIKHLKFYRGLASKTFASFNIPEDDEIDYDTFLKMLDFLNMFMIHSQARRMFDTMDLKKGGRIGIIEFENLLMAKDALGVDDSDLIVLDIFDSLKTQPLQALLVSDENNDNTGSGLDFSGFYEASQALGCQEENDEKMMEAFCYGAGIKIKDVEHTYLKINQFRKAWLYIADLSLEMEKRGMKHEDGTFAEARNRERLLRVISDVENAYIENLEKINSFVEKVKQDRRQKKDEKKREEEAFRERLQHEANKFVALRAQEKRLRIKKEQEERAKKRVEDKVLRNKLLLRQQENEAQKRAEIAEANLKSERLRLDEIRAAGLDTIDYSVQNHRFIPPDLYNTQATQVKLTYAVNVDFSHNELEWLPEKNFFYWMNEAKKLKLSQNRLKSISDDLTNMNVLEILEVDNNRLVLLPDDLGNLKNLKRLDISNNLLNQLPDSIGQLSSLKYLNVQCNKLTYIPVSIGSCFKLEFLDASSNQLIELPEDCCELISLTHLDLSSNRIGRLPKDIGKCEKLVHLNIATNSINFLPDSFSCLKNLEYFDAENNSICLSAGNFENVAQMKSLNLRKNSVKHFYYDLGKACNLIFLDCSSNNLEYLPPEIGLLVQLQTLKLYGNCLRIIPNELGSCHILQHLDLANNYISGSLPESFGLLSNLEVLVIAFNEIEEIPRSVVGLQQLRRLHAKKNRLSFFPDTLIYLENLKIIDVSSNKFRKFPIELHQMKSLEVLNLSHNLLELLPRSINAFTNVSRLDLSRNRLRAVPVEFVDVLETVPEVLLHQNPWSDFPSKWGKLWPGTCSPESAEGYSVSDALDFLYGVRAIYDTAETIWGELGVFHYSGRLGFEDFLQEFRERIPKTWHEGLIPYAKHIYFTSRRTGSLVRWYQSEEAADLSSKLIQLVDIKRREDSINRSKRDLDAKLSKLESVYNTDATRRMRHVNELSAEHLKNEEILDRMAMTALFHNVQQKEEDITKKIIRREKKLHRQDTEEMDRLHEILAADESNRSAARKRDRRKAHLMQQINAIRDASIGSN